VENLRRTVTELELKISQTNAARQTADASSQARLAEIQSLKANLAKAESSLLQASSRSKEVQHFDMALTPPDTHRDVFDQEVERQNAETGRLQGLVDSLTKELAVVKSSLPSVALTRNNSASIAKAGSVASPISSKAEVAKAEAVSSATAAAKAVFTAVPVVTATKAASTSVPSSTTVPGSRTPAVLTSPTSVTSGSVQSRASVFAQSIATGQSVSKPPPDIKSTKVSVPTSASSGASSSSNGPVSGVAAVRASLLCVSCCML